MTASFTQSTLSFVYSKLVRHQVDAENPPGIFIVETDLADIGTGPFFLERYEPNVKTVFTHNPDYFQQGQPSCVPEFRHDHRLLATVRQELCAQLQLRLRQSRRGAVAGPPSVE